MIWPLGELSKALPTLNGEYKQVFADGHREADASIRLLHSVANSYERWKGSQEVTIIRISANNGFVRGNLSLRF
jgi:hypothetical protein